MSEYLILNAKPMLPSEIIIILESSKSNIDNYLGEDIYANNNPQYLQKQKSRLIDTLKFHQSRVGDVPTYLLRAPGRLNAFLEYLDMCTGDHMSTTIDGDILMAVSPREDDVINAANINPLFPAEEIRIKEEFKRFSSEPLENHAKGVQDNWDNRTLILPYYGRPKGSWLNYILSSYLRVMWDNPEMDVKGADLSFGQATAPFRAGTSSSSALVVLAFLTLYITNEDKLPKIKITDACSLLGEAEWYVGTHGGANDQTTILRNLPNYVLYNRHSWKKLDCTVLPFLKGVHVVLANSLWEVNKSLSGNQSFNMRKGWMEIGDEVMKLIITSIKKAVVNGNAAKSDWIQDALKRDLGFNYVLETPLLEKHFDYWDKIISNYHKFGSLDETILGIPNDIIEELISLLPVKITPKEAAKLFGKDVNTIERLYTKPKRSIGGYHTRTTARFFHKENVIGRNLERIFNEAENKISSGEIDLDSIEYDEYRKIVGRRVDELQHTISYDFRISNSQLDRLLDIAHRGPGYLGGKLTGAGKGGCVSILVREKDSQTMCEYLDKEYYNKRANFEEYRQILEDALKYYHEDDFERMSAEERLQNLENALNNIEDQRRVITFSRGACVLDFGNLQ